MKGITHALVLIFLVLLLNSCFSPYSGKEEMATITISLGDGAARAPVWPDLTNSSSPHFSKIRHMVILTDSTGFSREIPMGPGVLSTTRTVPPETYTAKIVGYYRDILFAEDMTTYGTSNPQTVTAGTPTPLTFSMQKVAAIYIVNNEDDWNDLQDNYPDGWMAIDYMDDGVRDFILEITSSFEIEGGDLFLGASDITATIFGNGFTLSKDPTPGTGYIFEIETPDQTVIIQDLNLEGIPGNNNALISVGNHATLIMMENSSIFGNENGGNATPGGGVYVGADGTFIMEGGSITGNDADSGGGVFVDDGGIFEMKGGTITGNAAIGFLVFGEGRGGGVYVDKGTLIVEGGSITGNTAINYASYTASDVMTGTNPSYFKLKSNPIIGAIILYDYNTIDLTGAFTGSATSISLHNNSYLDWSGFRVNYGGIFPDTPKQVIVGDGYAVQNSDMQEFGILTGGLSDIPDSWRLRNDTALNNQLNWALYLNLNGFWGPQP